jgi:hypothetical protein
MMRCDVTKFNKRFGICKVMTTAGSGLGHGLHDSLGGHLPCISRSPAHLRRHHVPAPWPALQMSAKAYVGEDIVCEAELTLVMGK